MNIYDKIKSLRALKADRKRARDEYDVGAHQRAEADRDYADALDASAEAMFREIERTRCAPLRVPQEDAMFEEIERMRGAPKRIAKLLHSLTERSFVSLGDNQETEGEEIDLSTDETIDQIAVEFQRGDYNEAIFGVEK